MSKGLTFGCIVIALAPVFCATATFGQDDHATVPPPCISLNEPVYEVSSKGIKPPEPTKLNAGQKNAPKIPENLRLELVVNSEGRVCSARVLAARDPSQVQEFVDYVQSHWKFKPATRQGKPVAVKFLANFAGTGSH